MKATLQRAIERLWYHDPIIGTWLMPLGFLFSDWARCRAWLYRIGVLKTQHLPVPVIIVGNLTVGGTGKTPLVIWLARWLATQGYRPGIVSRGYGGQNAVPQTVSPDSPAELVGDEAVLLAQHGGCPVAVGKDRPVAARLLLAAPFACDVIVADDGLQHYALGRRIEIAVVDGVRRFGNGYCLPAGPLREPIGRLRSVDLVVVNGTAQEAGEFSMRLLGDEAVNLATGACQPLAGFAGQPCHAVAGIGHPQRFFNQLTMAGLKFVAHPFPDHHAYQSADVAFADGCPVLMTEKDAVKCRAFATAQHWSVPVKAEPDADFAVQLLHLLKTKAHDR